MRPLHKQQSGFEYSISCCFLGNEVEDEEEEAKDRKEIHLGLDLHKGRHTMGAIPMAIDFYSCLFSNLFSSNIYFSGMTTLDYVRTIT